MHRELPTSNDVVDVLYPGKAMLLNKAVMIIPGGE